MDKPGSTPSPFFFLREGIRLGWGYKIIGSFVSNLFKECQIVLKI
jgi:hypothetical protein